MERIKALIDKLYEQQKQNVNAAHLLLTVQLLQSELLKLQNRNGTMGTSKVAVTLPLNLNLAEEDEVFAAEEAVRSAEAKVQVNGIRDPEVAKAPMQVANQSKEYQINKPKAKEEIIQEAPPPVFAKSQQVLNPAFTPSEDIPTISQHQLRKELHEMLGENKESLNDRLKEEKTEVVHVLKDSPIKDLRKAIGINDRFTFVNELFRGDEAMYERSIKTINGFHILSEAEYWINRELKFKLGWNDNKELVQHFYHLVRRRFS